MTLPSTLLVPLDGSDEARRATPVASALAAGLGADLVLMTTPQTRDTAGREEPPPWLAEAASDAGAVPTRTRFVLDDRPADAITRTARDLGDAAVCMTTHGHGRVLGAALGHVAEDVVRTLRTPVVLVGPDSGPWHAAGPLLVCHDGSAAADAIIPVAKEWATALGLPLSLAFAFHPLDVESAQQLPTRVTDAAAALGPSVPLHSVRDAYPAGAIRHLAEQLRPSMLAMSTHGRTGWARLALGSVATTVVRASACPVLVVRPDGLSGRGG
jgi:nucleotide-binding universal stress UspA family protein